MEMMTTMLLTAMTTMKKKKKALAPAVSAVIILKTTATQAADFIGKDEKKLLTFGLICCSEDNRYNQVDSEISEPKISSYESKRISYLVFSKRINIIRNSDLARQASDNPCEKLQITNWIIQFYPWLDKHGNYWKYNATQSLLLDAFKSLRKVLNLMDLMISLPWICTPAPTPLYYGSEHILIWSTSLRFILINQFRCGVSSLSLPAETLA